LSGAPDALVDFHTGSDHSNGMTPGANLMPGIVARSFVKAAFAAACLASRVVFPIP